MKTYTITVNGNVYDVTVEEKDGADKVATTPTVSNVEKKENKPVKKTSNSGGKIAINSPMPGKILEIKKKVGDSVKKDEVVILLEAMKMENEIVASEDGVIASINVSVGENVEAGAVLATLN